MGIRERFSNNLRRLSLSRKSHAQVARDLGINRQQFNNYLNAKNLPNETVIDKICKYFDVDLSYMFTEISSDLAQNFINEFGKYEKNILNRFISVAKEHRKNRLRDGIYYIYFALHNNPDQILCSILAVKNQRGISYFRRLTRLSDQSETAQFVTQSLHAGIAICRHNSLLLFGLNVLEGLSPSLISGQSVVSSKVLYVGHAIVRAGLDFENVPFAIIAAPRRTSLKTALGAAKVKSVNDPTLDREVVGYLRKLALRQVHAVTA